jgi:hypothetical protein
LVLTLILVLAIQYARSPWRKVPPGPRGLPIIGNALDLKDKDFLFGKECKRKFGAFCIIFAGHENLRVYQRYPEHMMYLNSFGQSVLVCNSVKAASDLLDRRAHIYSDRPRFIVAHEILSGGLFTVTMTYGDM